MSAHGMSITHTNSMGGVKCAPAVRQAEELGVLLSRYDLRSHVNLIPWNPVDDSPYERPSRNAVHAFADVLETSYRIPTSIRITRGARPTRDIMLKFHPPPS